MPEHSSGPRAVAVLDAGYTNTKLLLIDASLSIIAEQSAPTAHRDGPPYRHLDPEPALAFAARALAAFERIAPVDVVVPCAHGSAFALLDGAGALALPVMDYAAEPPEAVAAAYAAVAPPFSEVFCGVSPSALTVGRQLFWQERAWPALFARAATLLPWGQYLAYRLCGVAASEVTALGAQSQLWDVRGRRLSSLARTRGWAERMAPLRPAWAALGPLEPRFRPDGARGGAHVLTGVHDSSANFLRYAAAGFGAFTLLSTGTWIIGFAPGADIDRLDPRFDVATNTGVDGAPIAASRFMGGEEFRRLADGAPPDAARRDCVLSLLQRGVMATPSFTTSGGPAPGTGGRGRVLGADRASMSEQERASLAALYCALMTELSLEALGARGDIVVDGPFAQSDAYMAALAALTPNRTVRAAAETQGAAIGAALLAFTTGAPGAPAPPNAPLAAPPVAPDAALLAHLPPYRAAWRRRLHEL